MIKLFLISLLLFLFISCGHKDDIPFNSDEWKNWVESGDELRLRKDILTYLLGKHNLIGISKEELHSLLGTPIRSTKKTYSYYLGYSRSWGINTITLVFYLDSNDIVYDYKEYEG